MRTKRSIDSGGAPRRVSAPHAAALAAAFLGVLFASPLAAQKLFHFGPWTGKTEVAFGVNRQESFSLFAPEQLFDRQLAEEQLMLRSSMVVADRRFVTVDYGFTVGLLQSRLLTERQEGEGRGRLDAFDLSATYRPTSPTWMTLLFNRFVNETPVEFAGTRELRTGSLGLNMGVGPRRFPGTLSVRQSELETVSDLGSFVRSIDQRRRILDYAASNRWQRHELYASYRFEDVDDRVTRKLSHRAQSASLSHRFELLAPDLATLSSLVRVFDRSGGLETSSLYLDEVLRLQHRKNLATTFRYLVQTNESFSGPDSDSQRALVGLHHRLYESLETDLLWTRTRTTSPGSETGLEELGVDSTYKKRLPGRGSLAARLTSRYEARDSRRGNGQELVTGERHIARFGVPARLERPEVIPETVVVTDELRTTIFEEGADYDLLFFADFAEITPIPGGGIRDGQTILVEYRIRAPAENRSTALRNGIDLSLDYGWVAPFVGYRSVDNRLEEGVFDRLLDDQEDRFAGIRFRFAGRRLQLVSWNELRIRDSELQAFELLRFGESLTYQPGARLTLRLHLAHLATDFSLPRRETRISEGRASIRFTPYPGLSLETYASHRLSEDTAGSDRTFERYGFQGRWIFGKITVLGSLERWQRDRVEDEVELERLAGLTASLRISRRFFPGRLSAPRRRAAPEPWPADLPGLWSQPAPPSQPGGEADSAAAEMAEDVPADLPPAAGLGEADPGVEPAAAEAVAEAAAAEAPVEETGEEVEAEVAAAIEAWAVAWSGQRVDEYLSFYGEAFRPPASGGPPAGDRTAWERLRQSRLLGPRSIHVTISDLDIEAVEPGAARARFRQTYRSDLYADVVVKTLELVLEDGDWKIQREQIEKQAAGS